MMIVTDPSRYKEKEDLYIQVRDTEGRIVSDELLLTLPDVPENNSYNTEWKMRANSFSRFRAYLEKRYNSRSLNILDIGCGNGWMSYNLAKGGHTLAGVDLNMAELQQAERVFSMGNNLKWFYADVMKDDIPGGPFDIILFSASCQYFSNIKDLTGRTEKLLTPNGEIHLLDSVFYKRSQIYEAKARSMDYYSRLGFPLMAQYYFHHTTDDLKSCGYKKLYPGPLSYKKPLQWWVWRKN
ncbi:class I SAM-dependent methyltransferase [Polluticoccus soli]|uniref:class I SAM-dependent methyltransferase n=1 Tax=Polluticoccus soli TaxID=3034150 RepID=UPI0023E1C041|nr:class I SAM-dependent methyltransferase [Flavipsychrobacter sp. JY13-12]